MSQISFGDRVRIHQMPETEALGVAGRVGQVLDGGAEAVWFAPRLLELVDHAPGTEIRVGDRVAVRDSKGNWVEGSAGHSPLEPETQKPWWKFW